MIVLALETATSVCSVALFRNGEIAAHATLHRPRSHAEHLVPMIADVLRYGQVRAADITAVAVSSGPGSYTGLRIGVGTAKGLAAAVDAKLVAVPSLFALADRVRPLAGRNDLIAAAFDARRDEAYAALYRVTQDGMLETRRETTALPADEAVAWLGDTGDATLYLVGNGWTTMRDRFDGISYRLLAGEACLPSAVTVARIGAKKLHRGEVEDLITFEPYYLKEFIATKPKVSAFEKLSF